MLCFFYMILFGRSHLCPSLHESDTCQAPSNEIIGHKSCLGNNLFNYYFLHNLTVNKLFPSNFYVLLFQFDKA